MKIEIIKPEVNEFCDTCGHFMPDGDGGIIVHLPSGFLVVPCPDCRAPGATSEYIID